MTENNEVTAESLTKTTLEAMLAQLSEDKSIQDRNKKRNKVFEAIKDLEDGNVKAAAEVLETEAVKWRHEVLYGEDSMGRHKNAPKWAVYTTGLVQVLSRQYQDQFEPVDITYRCEPARITFLESHKELVGLEQSYPVYNKYNLLPGLSNLAQDLLCDRTS